MQLPEYGASRFRPLTNEQRAKTAEATKCQFTADRIYLQSVAAQASHYGKKHL